MRKFLSLATLVCLVLWSYAGNVRACSYDFADATGYNNAGVYAQNPTWNRLGITWSGESGPVANNGDLDDGVSWSINGGDYGQGDITVGDKVTFQFTLSKVEWGRHVADYLKAWIDWDGSMTFDITEVIVAKTYNFISNTAPDGSQAQFLDQTNHLPVIVATYYKTIDFTNVAVGDYWLRARVACNADAGTLSAFSPMGSYYQGEIEDWKLTVKQRVPEPASMLLLGLGLAGLAGVRRKFKK